LIIGGKESDNWPFPSFRSGHVKEQKDDNFQDEDPEEENVDKL